MPSPVSDYLAGESPRNQVTTRGDKVARESALLPDSNERLDILRHSIRKLRTMKKYILSLQGIFVATAFIASCQQEGTTDTTEPANGSSAYMNRPAPSPTR